MQYKKIMVALLAATVISGCTEPNGEPGKGVENGGAVSGKDVGVAAGAVVGGVAGSAIGAGAGETIAVIGGGLLGAVLGGEIGSSMDKTDQLQYQRQSQQAMESGNATSWRNPENNHHGTIVPHKEFQNEDGQDCRKYRQTIYIEGQRHEAHGTACREDDGTWTIVE